MTGKLLLPRTWGAPFWGQCSHGAVWLPAQARAAGASGMRQAGLASERGALASRLVVPFACWRRHSPVGDAVVLRVMLPPCIERPRQRRACVGQVVRRLVDAAGESVHSERRQARAQAVHQQAGAHEEHGHGPEPSRSQSDSVHGYVKRGRESRRNVDEADGDADGCAGHCRRSQRAGYEQRCGMAEEFVGGVEPGARHQKVDPLGQLLGQIGSHLG
eukprot:scaffold32972_cov135-Isochrysis_galbana.AAC.3